MAKGSILSTKVPPDDMLEACVLTRGSVLNQQRSTLNAGVGMAGDTSLYILFLLITLFLHSTVSHAAVSPVWWHNCALLN